MPNQISLTQWVDGVQVTAPDLVQGNQSTRDLVALALQLVLGNVNGVLPPAGNGYVPLNIVPSTSTLSVTIGGPGQAVIAQNRLIDTCGAFTQNLTPNATGATRLDLIALQYTQSQINPQTRNFESTALAITTGTLYQTSESLTYNYVVGTSPTAVPAPPAGSIGFATIAVPNGATAVTSASISYLFPSVASIIQQLTGAVLSLNGAGGAITITGTGISVSTAGGVITLTNTGVTTLGTASGTVALNAGAGISTATTANSATITNTGVVSFAGQTGSLSLTTGSGIGLAQPNTTTTQISNTGVLSVNGLTQTVTFAAGANVTLTPAGNTITIASSATGIQGTQGIPGNNGGAGIQGIPGIPGPAGGIGSAYLATARIPLGALSAVTVTLPTLPSGNYSLVSRVRVSLSTSNQTLTLTGSSGTFESAQSGTNGAGPHALCEILGTAIGSQSPSVQLTFIGSGYSVSNAGTLELLAVRTS